MKIILLIMATTVTSLLRTSCYRLRPLTRLFNSGSNDDKIPSRFWSRSIDLATDYTGDTNIDALKEELESNDDTKSINLGFVIIPPSTDKEKKHLLVPINEGKVQSQHIRQVDLSHSSATTTSKAIIGAFNPRAAPVDVSPTEQERPIVQERLDALNQELEKLDIDNESLLSGIYAGTPPHRIYRSFVAPRPNKSHLLEPVERAAKRTASQIDLALRQVRADQAEYLRNLDNSMMEQSNNNINNNHDNNDNNDAHHSNGRGKKWPIAIVCDNVRSAFNVGSLFRTGETAGIHELITVGITPSPPHPKLRKTAMQSLDIVPNRHFEDVMQMIRVLKAEGYVLVVMETTSKSVKYTTEGIYNHHKTMDIEAGRMSDADSTRRKIALICGNEITGVDTRIIDQSDMIVEIPTFGVKNSLNVASAVPIVLFEMIRQFQQLDARNTTINTTCHERS